jgi:hypothetical protein
MARRTLRPARAAEIAELAHSVADYYFPSDDDWIDPELVIRELGITLSFGDYGDCFDGMLECRKGRFHIYCNLARVGNSTGGRARFTLGHELGHYFIDSHRNALKSGKAPAHPSFCSQPDPASVVEEEADHFASYLLMPEDRVSKVFDIDVQCVSLTDIIRVEEAFHVSFQSAAIRVLGSTRKGVCAGIMWQTGGKRWYRVSKALHAAGLQQVKRDINSLPADCATRKVMDLGDADRGAIQKCGTTASCWFSGIHPGTHMDILLIEEAKRLGQWGVFTLLSPRR